MKVKRVKLLAISFLCLCAASVLFLSDERSSASEDGALLSTGLGNVETLQASYEAWETVYEKGGGDRNMIVPLGANRATSTEQVGAYGQVRLNWIDGTVSAEVRGSPEGEEYDLWLIDNRETVGGTILPEPGDKMVRVGALNREGEAALLEADLGSEAFKDFEPDFFAVTRAGKSPIEDRLLVGMTTLFQRLHYSKSMGRFGTLSDSENPQQSASEKGILDRIAGFLNPTAKAQIGPIVNPTTPMEVLITEGRNLFFNNGFNGNGRTCGTCHRENNNLTIDPEFISTLPPNDPLFVAEFVPALARNFENPVLMRKVGLILENVDGMQDLANKFVMRGVPHTLALIPNTLTPSNIDGTTQPPNERTGWGGDGAPVGPFTLADGTAHNALGTLRDFIIGAINQHYPKTLARQAGVDFILPTVRQLDALEAFQKSTGRRADIKLAGPNQLRFKNAVVERGKLIFINPGTSLPPFVGTADGAGKCLFCHFNAGAGDFVEAVFVNGANPDPGIATEMVPSRVINNANFDTGVEDQPSAPADLLGQRNPPDGGFGQAPLTSPTGQFLGFGNRTFNTPVLVESADTGPFFHDNSVETIEAAVSFYNGPAFNNTPLAQGIGGIRLDATEVTAIAAMLRAVNALENIRSSVDLQTRARSATSFAQARELLLLSIAELADAIEVLNCGNLHPEARVKLLQAAALDAVAFVTSNTSLRNGLINQAINLKLSARGDIVQ